MVTQFTPVQPGWRVLFESSGQPSTWLPLLGWLNEPSAENQFQPCVWWGGLVPAETAADELGVISWSVVEQEYQA